MNDPIIRRAAALAAKLFTSLTALFGAIALTVSPGAINPTVAFGLLATACWVLLVWLGQDEEK